jgi:hypothetical protein
MRLMSICHRKALSILSTRGESRAHYPTAVSVHFPAPSLSTTENENVN